MRILYPLILALFTISVCAQEEAQAEKEVPVKIDCGKDCADFVAARLDAERAASSELLATCRADTEKVQNEHEKIVASLNDEIQTLKASIQKSREVESELRQINKDLEASFAKKEEAQKVLLAKAQDLARASQQQTMEASLEMKDLMERLESQRINLKGMWDDLMAMWKKLVASVKKVTAKEQEQTPDF